MQQRIDREEWNEWKTSPVTEQFLNFLRLEAELTRRALASGNVKGPTPQDTGRLYENLLTQAEAYERIANDVQYEDVFPEEGYE